MQQKHNFCCISFYFWKNQKIYRIYEIIFSLCPVSLYVLLAQNSSLMWPIFSNHFISRQRIHLSIRWLAYIDQYSMRLRMDMLSPMSDSSISVMRFSSWLSLRHFFTHFQKNQRANLQIYVLLSWEAAISHRSLIISISRMRYRCLVENTMPRGMRIHIFSRIHLRPW